MDINEHDIVVLLVARSFTGLAKGDVGTVVHVYGDGDTLEVEFTTLGGDTVCIETLPRSAVRPVANDDRMHARPARAG
ncbi:MAG: DUF4926 domain-containing protein [Pseudomonadota bacterium]